MQARAYLARQAADYQASLEAEARRKDAQMDGANAAGAGASHAYNPITEAGTCLSLPAVQSYSIIYDTPAYPVLLSLYKQQAPAPGMVPVACRCSVRQCGHGCRLI